MIVLAKRYDDKLGLQCDLLLLAFIIIVLSLKPFP